MKYSDQQIDTMLNHRLRRGLRPTPWPRVAMFMGLNDTTGLEDLFWKVVTGYSGKNPDGPRRVYIPTTGGRDNHTGLPFEPREIEVMEMALLRQGQRREPACDFAYVAAILARNEDEVEAEWNKRQNDPLGRAGFGFG